jgi:alkylhydroperoxidase family enzyme
VLGLGDEALVAAVLEDWRTAPVNEKVRSMLGFLEKLTCSPSEVGPEDIEPLRSVGIGDRAIEEALYVSFNFNTIDRLADAFDFEIPSAEGHQRNGRFLYKTGYRIGSIPG